jgi:hypothetical protein
MVIIHMGRIVAHGYRGSLGQAHGQSFGRPMPAGGGQRSRRVATARVATVVSSPPARRWQKLGDF